jgi:hypothetical protein
MAAWHFDEMHLACDAGVALSEIAAIGCEVGPGDSSRELRKHGLEMQSPVDAGR